MFQLAVRLGSGSFNDVGAGKSLNKNFLGTINDGSNWYHLINIRHRNGNSDGVNYGMQIRNLLNTSYPELRARLQANGTWSNWYGISTWQTLYSDATGTTGGVTLNMSASNFHYLEIHYYLSTTDVGKIYSSTKVCASGYAELGINRALPNNGAQIVSNLINISGTSLNRTYDSYYTFTTGAISGAGSSKLHITKVMGYR